MNWAVVSLFLAAVPGYVRSRVRAGAGHARRTRRCWGSRTSPPAPYPASDHGTDSGRRERGGGGGRPEALHRPYDPVRIRPAGVAHPAQTTPAGRPPGCSLPADGDCGVRDHQQKADTACVPGHPDLQPPHRRARRYPGTGTRRSPEAGTGAGACHAAPAPARLSLAGAGQRRPATTHLTTTHAPDPTVSA